MNALAGTIDGAFVINLAHRIDRWQHAQTELAKIGIDAYERFNAWGMNNPPPGVPAGNLNPSVATTHSHCGVIRFAQSRGLTSVLVLEDDVIFDGAFNEIVGKAICQLRDLEWEWLQFGGNYLQFGPDEPRESPIDGMPYSFPPTGLKQVSPNLSRILKMLTSHAYVVRESCYPFILEHAPAFNLSIDRFFAYEIHQRFRCYCVRPCVATQMPGISDIGNCYSDLRPLIS